MAKFRVTITVHKDHIVEIDAASKTDAIEEVNANMSEYTSGNPADYSYSEITDVETM